MLFRIVCQVGKLETATLTSASLFRGTFIRSLRFSISRMKDKIFARAARLPEFLAFVPVADVEEAFYEITFYIQSNYPQLMSVVNYFEKTYLGAVTVDNEVRVPPTYYPVGFWNHFDRILWDPEFPRTSNMVEGFHRGFKIRVNRPKPSVQDLCSSGQGAASHHRFPLGSAEYW